MQRLVLLDPAERTPPLNTRLNNCKNVWGKRRLAFIKP
jgi:hypothetical protein